MEMDGNILFFIEGSRELLPGYAKTSKGIILPREIYYALSSIDGMVKEIGVVRKEKSKTKHILGLKTHQHSNTARLVGNEVIFRGRDRQQYTDTQGQKHKVFHKILSNSQ
jgi:hypothetical protein